MQLEFSEYLEPVDSIQTSVSGWKLKDLAVFYKFRLAIIVVLSSVLGYFMGTSSPDWIKFGALCVGGILLTGASNGLNQVWERNLDKLMNRTKDRPVASGKMSKQEGIIVGSLSAVLGLLVIWYFLGVLSMILGGLAFFSYLFLYTPLKQKSALSVLVGAFPGAIPPMLGYVAATGDFGLEPGILFMVQFMWQFPHFWAIAWVSYHDYSRAGFKMLPFNDGRSDRTAFLILLYSLMLIPIGMLPWVLPLDGPMVNNLAMIVSVICGIWFSWYAWKFYKSRSDKDIKRLMFASFIYLPIVQIFYVIGKI